MDEIVDDPKGDVRVVAGPGSRDDNASSPRQAPPSTRLPICRQLGGGIADISLSKGMRVGLYIE